MEIYFTEIENESIALVLKDAYIYNWDSTHFDCYYELDINEYDSEKKLCRTTKLEKLCWENWTLSAELFRAWHDKKSQELNIKTGSYDNNFGLSIIVSETMLKLYFDIGTGANYYRPIPYGTAFYQDLYWDDLLRISLEVFVMELCGLKKEYQKKLKENNKVEKFDVVNRIKIIEKKIIYYSNLEYRNFCHPGNIIEIIMKEAVANKSNC